MVERVTSPSRKDPGWIDVLITGDSLEEVQGEIFNFEYEGYSQMEFTNPARAADNRWMAKGRVR